MFWIAIYTNKHWWETKRCIVKTVLLFYFILVIFVCHFMQQNVNAIYMINLSIARSFICCLLAYHLQPRDRQSLLNFINVEKVHNNYKRSLFHSGNETRFTTCIDLTMGTMSFAVYVRYNLRYVLYKKHIM